jgi:hypothetical protein
MGVEVGHSDLTETQAKALFLFVHQQRLHPRSERERIVLRREETTSKCNKMVDFGLFIAADFNSTVKRGDRLGKGLARTLLILTVCKQSTAVW